jgi:hypothetical protein
VVVGQLRGDVVTMTLAVGNASNAVLCIELNTGITPDRYATVCFQWIGSLEIMMCSRLCSNGNFAVPDLGTCDDGYVLSSFKPLDLPVTLYTDDSGNNYICGPVSVSGTISSHLLFSRLHRPLIVAAVFVCGSANRPVLPAVPSKGLAQRNLSRHADALAARRFPHRRRSLLHLDVRSFVLL